MLKKGWKSLNRNMASNKGSLLFIGLLLTIALVMTGAGILIYRTIAREKNAPLPQTFTPTPTPKAQASLAFSPNPLTLSSQSGSIDVIIDTQTSRITAVQLEISYDPKILTDVDIVPGAFFTDVIPFIKKVDISTGRISYAVGLTPTAQAVQGKGVAATITFRSNLAPGEKTEVKFLPQTLLTAEGVSTSVLGDTSDTTILFTP